MRVVSQKRKVLGISLICVTKAEENSAASTEANLCGTELFYHELLL